MRYHPAHDHWHVLDFARYELRKDPSGKLVVGSRKVGFCLVDTRPVFPGPVTPEHPRYPFGSHLPTSAATRARPRASRRAGRTPMRSRSPASSSTSPACGAATTA